MIRFHNQGSNLPIVVPRPLAAEGASEEPRPSARAFDSGGGTRTPDTRIMIPLL